MKDFIIGALAGAIAYHLWSQEKAGNPPKISIQDLATDVKAEEGEKYKNVMERQYKIVMPSDMINKKVREKADRLTAGRYSVDILNQKAPVQI